MLPPAPADPLSVRPNTPPISPRMTPQMKYAALGVPGRQPPAQAQVRAVALKTTAPPIQETPHAPKLESSPDREDQPAPLTHPRAHAQTPDKAAHLRRRECAKPAESPNPNSPASPPQRAKPPAPALRARRSELAAPTCAARWQAKAQ